MNFPRVGHYSGALYFADLFSSCTVCVNVPQHCFLLTLIFGAVEVLSIHYLSPHIGHFIILNDLRLRVECAAQVPELALRLSDTLKPNLLKRLMCPM